MIKINCKGCSKNCCGKIKNLRPVLIPSEEKKFGKNSDIVKIKFRKMLVLKRKENGNCIFLDDKTSKCKIYSERPLECKLYPLLLDFSEGKAKVILDKRYCKHLEAFKADIKQIEKTLSKIDFPEDWINAHSIMDDY